MLGDSAVLGGGGGSSGGGGEGGSGDAVAAVASGGGGEGAAAAAAGGGSNSGDEERGSFGGNRWPRQETLALLRIRSDMDVAFRDATAKGPLWEDVSRKMAELGYHRSAKKCKEKFENVYKYHKRTKDGRSGKPDGKTYRFFDQLEAFENHPPTTITHQSPKPQQQQSPPSQAVTTTTMAMPPLPPHVTVPSTTTTTTLPMVMPHGITTATTPSINLTIPSYPPLPPPPTTTSSINPTSLFPHSTPNPTTTTTTTTTTNPPHTTTLPISFNIPTDLLSNYSSSSTSSDETLEGSRKRKRKWKDFFERLMKEVVEKQEELQKRFLEAIEKRERDRMAREEAWRVQEMQRINRERELLAQERSIAAAKDAAVMSFLQKIAEQQNLGQALNTISIVQPQQQSQPRSQPQPQSISIPVPQAPLPVQRISAPVVQPVVLPMALAPQTQIQQQPQPQQVTGMEIVKVDNNNNNKNNGEDMMSPSSSRWPKVEVEALIKLRTSLDAKYQENGPKGPLWEEISSSMRKLGYNRNAKRCKEKWENINKYFKKVKESNKKRPEDSKTCPYFHQLDALYREKNRLESGVVTAAKPESMVAPLMVRPEQQWPPQPGVPPPGEVAMEDVENDPMDRQHHHQDHDEEDTEDDDEDEDDDDDEGGSGGGGGGNNNYEIVASKPASARPDE